MSHKIHGRPMQPGCLRVSVSVSIKPDALLPVPILGEMEKVYQAVGSYVAWPQNLIIFPTDVVCISFKTISSQFVCMMCGIKIC